MSIYHIKIDWVDFNPTLENDIYKVSVLDNEGNVIMHKECTKHNVPIEIAQLLEVASNEANSQFSV